MHQALFLAGLVCLAASTGLAQDPAKVDPKHVKVDFENDSVRVLRIHLGPHEEIPMHEHPARVIIWLTDIDFKSTTADGKEQLRRAKPGEVTWGEPTKHTTVNLSDKPADLIDVELKLKPAAAKHAAKKPGT